jgi:formamidopyrimidine-DNA glycosylase
VPELPEIQAHAERLEATYAGTPLERFTPLAFTVLKTATPGPEAAYGTVLRAVGRRGKHLLLDFGVVTFVVHLMQGGRLKPDEKQAAKPRFGQARWRFADGRALLLTEAGTERKAGVWVVEDDPDGQAPLLGLGPDADTIDEATLQSRLRGQGVRLHGFLRDQHQIAGLGRLLANEICHRAKLSPFASSSKLSPEQVTALAAAVQECIAESLAEERTHDEMVKSAERGGIHHGVGQPCPRCGDTIRAVEYRAYTVAYCPTCQTDGKILADNTTSKFLK